MRRRLLGLLLLASPLGWSDAGRVDLDLGMQTRSFAERGMRGEPRFQPSVSARIEYQRSWADGLQRFTATPYLRIDATDDERTHADLRELFWSRIGRDWELHLGARQVFWGVTEFNHLVDVINQTDLVENIDGEDKLGQPMAQVSLIRDWGIVDLYLLTGFRERTFPGADGRLGGPVRVDADAARYSSGAEAARVDGALRWTQHWGPLSLGLHHFSGTSRSPDFEPMFGRDGEARLRPVYRVIDQTGLDAQLIVADWAFKLEALTRSGAANVEGARYHAYTAGFERTLVGVLGSRGDLGLVVEYLYDQRGRAAHDTLYEDDLALGARWLRNDMADTQALIGLIRDLDTAEYVLSLEASRRLGASWLLALEGRVFGGAGALDPAAPLAELLQTEHKSAALQRDDFVQLELTRYF